MTGSDLKSNLEAANLTVASSNYELRIRPTRNWIRIDWRALWEYRDLLFLLVRRDFVARYAQSVLGPVWFVVLPLLTTFVFTIVFAGIAKIPTGGVPPLLFYLCNQLAWGYFSSCFNSTSTTLANNQNLFSKVYFPRLIVPLSGLISNLFTVAIQFTAFLVFFVSFKVSDRGAGFNFTAAAWVLPVIILHLAALGAGFGLWMTALTAKYRDLSQLSPLFIQLGMYATPVIYPLSGVPEKWRWLVALNPVSLDIEAFRLALLGLGTITPLMIFSSLSLTLLFLVTGLALFGKVEKTFVDVA